MLSIARRDRGLDYHGYLKEFVAGIRDHRKPIKKKAKGKEPREGSPKEEEPYGPKKGTYIGIIARGSTLASSSKRSIKTYRRNIVVSKEVNRPTGAHLPQLHT